MDVWNLIFKFDTKLFFPANKTSWKELLIYFKDINKTVSNTIFFKVINACFYLLCTLQWSRPTAGLLAPTVIYTCTIQWSRPTAGLLAPTVIYTCTIQWSGPTAGLIAPTVSYTCTIQWSRPTAGLLAPTVIYTCTIQWSRQTAGLLAPTVIYTCTTRWSRPIVFYLGLRLLLHHPDVHYYRPTQLRQTLR